MIGNPRSAEKAEIRAVGLGYNPKEDVTENMIRGQAGVPQRGAYE